MAEKHRRITNLFRINEFFYWVLAAGAVLESLLALWQFGRQLGIDTPGVAKVLIGGGRLMRAYGTFPHPNVLAAFLTLGLISLFYFMARTANRYQYTNYLFPIGLFIVSLGLLFTFSRAAWLAGGLIFSYFSRRRPLLFIIPLVIFAFFHWLIVPRLQFFPNEPALALRRTYNQIGWEIIKTHPFSGVGFGQQTAYAVQNGLYQKYGLTQEWQWQPVHNLYLLVASEAGLVGLGLFLILVIYLLFKPHTPHSISSKLMLSALLLLGFFDHFLWTLLSGRIMLILVMGLVLAAQLDPVQKAPIA